MAYYRNNIIFMDKRVNIPLSIPYQIVSLLLQWTPLLRHIEKEEMELVVMRVGVG